MRNSSQKAQKVEKPPAANFFKRYLSVGSPQKKPSRLDASENELSDEAGGPREDGDTFCVGPSQVGSEKNCGFPQAGVCLVSGLQSLCHTREGGDQHD